MAWFLLKESYAFIDCLCKFIQTSGVLKVKLDHFPGNGRGCTSPVSAVFYQYGQCNSGIFSRGDSNKPCMIPVMDRDIIFILVLISVFFNCHNLGSSGLSGNCNALHPSP
jgi:hypothetical protein